MNTKVGDNNEAITLKYICFQRNVFQINWSKSTGKILLLNNFWKVIILSFSGLESENFLDSWWQQVPVTTSQTTRSDVFISATTYHDTSWERESRKVLICRLSWDIICRNKEIILLYLTFLLSFVQGHSYLVAAVFYKRNIFINSNPKTHKFQKLFSGDSEDNIIDHLSLLGK